MKLREKDTYMERKKAYSLLLLAGGKSSRMGRNKAELRYEGKTFADLLIAKGRALGIDKIYISGFEYQGTYGQKQIHTVWDRYQDRGPLGGLHACMKEVKTPFCLILPIDAPMIPQNILEELLCRHEKARYGIYGEKEIPFIWEHGDRKEPLIAVYPSMMADDIERLIREKAVPVFRMLDAWGYECCRLEMEEPQVINVNTPELYEELLRNAEREEK